MKIIDAYETLNAESSAALIYPDCIPSFAERGLDKLYESLYASLPQLRCDSLSKVNTYAAWRDGRLSALLMYNFDGQHIRVINEGMHVPPEELERFANTLFRQYTKASVISLHALPFSNEVLQRPSACMAVTEDIVIDLPESEEAYLAQMGKSSRKSIRQHRSRAQHELPGFRHQLVIGEAISQTLVDQIIGFNHARMTRKHRQSAMDKEAQAHLMRLLRARGWVGVISTDERICAGTLACRFGDAVYSLVNAHDPLYDEYSMGNLSRHLLINASIRAGVRRFHMLGGQWSTKRNTMGRRHMLYELRLYRSRLSIVRDTLHLIRLARQSAIYRLKTWMDDLKAQPKRGKIITTLLHLQKIRRVIRGYLQGL